MFKIYNIPKKIYISVIDFKKLLLNLQVPANDTQVDDMMTCMISNLKPGELYSFLFYVVSHSLRSEGIGIQTRTSKF